MFTDNTTIQSNQHGGIDTEIHTGAEEIQANCAEEWFPFIETQTKGVNMDIKDMETVK